MKKVLTISFLIISIGLADNLSDTIPDKKTVAIEYFKSGDILYPDYALPDTLVVVNAVQLNKDMALIEQGIIEATDGEISAIFYKHCELYTK